MQRKSQDLDFDRREFFREVVTLPGSVDYRYHSETFIGPIWTVWPQRLCRVSFKSWTYC